MKYFYADANNQPQGPCELVQLEQLRADGTLTDATSVIPENGKEWKSLAHVLAVANLPPPPPIQPTPKAASPPAPELPPAIIDLESTAEPGNPNTSEATKVVTLPPVVDMKERQNNQTRMPHPLLKFLRTGLVIVLYLVVIAAWGMLSVIIASDICEKDKRFTILGAQWLAGVGALAFVFRNSHWSAGTISVIVFGGFLVGVPLCGLGMLLHSLFLTCGIHNIFGVSIDHLW